MNYKIITANNIDTLQKVINDHLNSNEGWELQGGISVSQSDNSLTIYAQAIINKN
jgi:hypothetical protein